MTPKLLDPCNRVRMGKERVLSKKEGRKAALTPAIDNVFCETTCFDYGTFDRYVQS